MTKYLSIFFFFLLGKIGAEPPAFLSIKGGAFEIVRHNKNLTADFSIEYRPKAHFWKIYPLMGFMATVKGATYLYGGIEIEWILQDRLVFDLNFTPGWYHQGGGKDLGFGLEFRSGACLAWQCKNFFRFGAHFYHISNASLGRKNPGVECLDFYLSIPLPK